MAVTRQVLHRKILETKSMLGHSSNELIANIYFHFPLTTSHQRICSSCRRTAPSSPHQSTSPTNFSSLRLKRIRENPHIPLNGTLVPQKLHISPIDPDFTFLALFEVLVATEGSEAPVLGDDDLLAAGEFVLCAAEGFNCCGFVWIVWRISIAVIR